ncbi:MAG: two pore domain potassium channel family protein [Thermoleophilaceae bacterium]|nr:two pore domain potassium channel family protein [Thermoleophilaceae bacterium]
MAALSVRRRVEAAGPMLSTGSRRRYGLLLLATLASLAVQGIVEPSGAQQVVVAALAGASLLLAFNAAQFGPRWLLPAAALSGAGIALAVVQATTGEVGEGVARGMNAILLAVGPPAVAVGVVRSLRTGTVKVEAVMGVLSLYMLLGMMFGFGYGVIDQYGNQPFFADGEQATVSQCLYFSFTTLTTVGYGDLVAETNLGHTLAVFEALLGQIYLVTIVSLIVGNLGRSRRAS